MPFKEELEFLLPELQKMASTKTVVGEPIQIAGVTLIPITSLFVGLGAGGAEGSGDTGSKCAMGASGGVGGGLRVSPVGMVVIKGDEVTLLPLGRKSGLMDKLAEIIPGLAAKVGDRIAAKTKAKAEEENAAGKPEE